MCGTRLADLLRMRGVPFLLAEARDELGGRIRTLRLDTPASYADLGPAWIWPHQPRVLDLVDELGLRTFQQHIRGQLVFEQSPALPARRLDMATMGGSLRLEGGLGTLVDGLAARIDPARLRLGAGLRRLERTGHGVRASFEDGAVIEARQVVLAMPPRVVASSLELQPDLPDTTLLALRSVPTWMAGHAKAVAIYDTPFWRERGLNGDAISHVGPLGELHDASPHDLAVGALFGFFAQPAAWRQAHRAELEALVLAQLERLYGEPAGSPTRLHIQDWARDPLVAVEADARMLREHPQYGPLPASSGDWAGILHLSGTELAPAEGGYVEGALVAAEATMVALG